MYSIWKENFPISFIGKGYLMLFSIFVVLTARGQNDSIVPIDKDPEELLKNLDLRLYDQTGFNLWNDSFSGHWSGFDFGFNVLLNEDYSGYDRPFMDNDVLRSNSAFINLLQLNIGLQRNRNTIGLVSGIGLQLQSYRLDKNTTINRLPDGSIEPQSLYFDHNQKSKFSIISLTVPLLAEFQIPLDHYKNRIYLSGGMYGGIRLGSHTKIKYRSEGKKEKLKTPGHYSLQDIKYGFMVRAGYRWINVFATYDLVPLFKEDKGPELTPLTFGVTLLSF
ncbi:MAG TPA: hypothetical protein VFD91_07125 [Mariniphaga sp.]|nr:hypothetical protein [Mariniphaga sp.]